MGNPNNAEQLAAWRTFCDALYARIAEAVEAGQPVLPEEEVEAAEVFPQGTLRQFAPGDHVVKLTFKHKPANALLV